jgi:hypothetical protein
VVRNLTWDRALKAYFKTKDRGDKPSPKQIAYFDKMERGLALQLVMSLGGTKAVRVVTYVGLKAITYKLGTFPNMLRLVGLSDNPWRCTFPRINIPERL